MPNFFSKKTFKNQPKPDPKKNFFQNYDDHLNHVLAQLYKKFPIDDFSELQNITIKTPTALLNRISDETVKHLFLFDSLRDGYDYFDEVIGTTAIPALAGLAAFGLAAAAIWEAMQELAIKFGFQKRDQDKHLDKAAANLLLAGTALVLSAVSFIKSFLSLFTRPIVTLINGYKPQNVDRFTLDDSKEDDVIAFLNS